MCPTVRENNEKKERWYKCTVTLWKDQFSNQVVKHLTTGRTLNCHTEALTEAGPIDFVSSLVCIHLQSYNSDEMRKLACDRDHGSK